MRRQNPILQQFKEISTHHLATLNPQEMREWIGNLHREVQKMPTPKHLQTRPKRKFIRKFNNKACFKQYIRERIRSIAASTLRRTLPKPLPTQTVKPKGGKLKFKQSTALWQKLQRFRTNVEAALGAETHDELTCPICLQTLINPALTLCGHVFCLQCLDQSMLFSHNCPNCRQNIRGSEPVVCTVFERLIRLKVHLNARQLTHYEDRVHKFEEWRVGRIPDYDKLQVGSLLDVRDTQSIWCQGQVLQIYKKQDPIPGQPVTIGVLMHYNRWNKLYNQVIELPSSRLAPLNCFSGRIDIPRYNLAEEEDNMRGSVISGPTRLELINPINYIQLVDSDDILISSSEEEEDEQEEEQQEEEEEEEEEGGRNALQDDEGQQNDASDNQNQGGSDGSNLRNYLDYLRAIRMPNRIHSQLGLQQQQHRPNIIIQQHPPRTPFDAQSLPTRLRTEPDEVVQSSSFSQQPQYESVNHISELNEHSDQLFLCDDNQFQPHMSEIQLLVADQSQNKQNEGLLEQPEELQDYQ